MQQSTDHTSVVVSCALPPPAQVVAEWAFQKDGVDISMRDLATQDKAAQVCLFALQSSSQMLASAMVCTILFSAVLQSC